LRRAVVTRVEEMRVNNMNKEYIEKIKENVVWYKKEADEILSGDRDNYDGADGARAVRDLCEYITDLIEEVDK